VYDGATGSHCNFLLRILCRPTRRLRTPLDQSVCTPKPETHSYLNSEMNLSSYPATSAKKANAKQELAFVNFNVTAGPSFLSLFVRPWRSFFVDLRPLFHWNTKQLFVWVEAEFNNTKKVCAPTCNNEPTLIIPTG